MGDIVKFTGGRSVSPNKAAAPKAHTPPADGGITPEDFYEELMRELVAQHEAIRRAAKRLKKLQND